MNFTRNEMMYLDGEMHCTVNNFTVGNIKRQMASMIEKELVIIQTLGNNEHIIIARIDHMDMGTRQLVLNSRLLNGKKWYN